jgi:hypothetical protein
VKAISNLLIRSVFGLGAVATVLSSPLQLLRAQDLAPRAYLITPIHGNAITMTYSFYDGSINFNGALPVSDAKGTYTVPIVSYYHSFGLFGRSANIVAGLPYGIGNFSGSLSGAEQNVYRSGLLDSVYRFSINLKGGPAMTPQEFAKWRQKVLLGAGLKVVVPTGQYDPTKLINWGTNRWSFKPEFGYSQRFGKWVLDGYVGAWFFTTNHDFWSRNAFYPGTRSQSQKPIVAFETHLSYDFKPRLWVSFDGNYWIGGSTSIAGIENPLTKQENSRLGATAAIPVTKHSSLKFGYSNGTYILYGGNYQNVSVAWQYSWLGRPN